MFLKGALRKSEFLQNYAPSGDKRNCNQVCTFMDHTIFCYSHNAFRGNKVINLQVILNI